MADSILEGLFGRELWLLQTGLAYMSYYIQNVKCLAVHCIPEDNIYNALLYVAGNHVRIYNL